MYKFSIKPEWQISSGNGRYKSLLSVIGLLTEIENCGNLAAACKRQSISYRHAWGILRDFESEFQVSLIITSRSKGTELTPISRKLIWANKRFEARVGPTLDALVSELEHEIATVTLDERPKLSIRVSYGFAVAELMKTLEEQAVLADFKYEDVSEGLRSLYTGKCEVAGFNVPLAPFARPVIALHAKHINRERFRFVYFVARAQGIMTAPGNPKKIKTVRDFARPDVRIINRQSQAGTKNLLDLVLQTEGISADSVRGYENREPTHAAVAAYVASGLADAGFGLLTVADKFGLHFEEVTTEHCYLVFDRETSSNPELQKMVSIIQSDEFRRSVNAIAGYRCERPAEILRVEQLEIQ